MNRDKDAPVRERGRQREKKKVERKARRDGSTFVLFESAAQFGGSRGADHNCSWQATGKLREEGIARCGDASAG